MLLDIIDKMKNVGLEMDVDKSKIMMKNSSMEDEIRDDSGKEL